MNGDFLNGAVDGFDHEIEFSFSDMERIGIIVMTGPSSRMIRPFSRAVWMISKRRSLGG